MYSAVFCSENVGGLLSHVQVIGDKEVDRSGIRGHAFPEPAHWLLAIHSRVLVLSSQETLQASRYDN